MPVAPVNHSIRSTDSGAEPDSASRSGPSRSARCSTGSPVREDRRRDRQHRDRLVLDDVERALGVEALDQHHPRLVAQQLAEHRVEPVDVEQRQHAEHDVVAVDHRRVDLGHLLDVGQQRPVAEHRGARATRRTGRVEEYGERLRVVRRRGRPAGLGDQVGPGRARRPSRRRRSRPRAAGTARARVSSSAPSSASVSPPTARAPSSTVSASANTIRAPESAIIRTSSPVALRGLTGTATSRARSAPR